MMNRRKLIVGSLATLAAPSIIGRALADSGISSAPLLRRWVGPGASGTLSWASPTYYMASSTISGTPGGIAMTAGRVYYIPCALYGLQINRLGFTTNSAVSGNARVAIATAVNGLPSTWLATSNTEISTNTTTTTAGADVGEITLPQLCFVCIQFSAAANIFAQAGSGYGSLIVGTDSAQSYRRGYYATDAYAAWDATPPTPTAFIGDCPYLIVWHT